MEREVQIFTTFSTQFDGAVKNLAKMAADQTTKWVLSYFAGTLAMIRTGARTTTRESSR